MSEETIRLDEKIAHVVVDFDRAGHLAGQHLISLGHRKIGAIVGEGLEGAQSLRLAGFKKALGEAGLLLAEKNTKFVDDNVEGGYQAANGLVSQGSELTALFTTTDLLAFGAAQALHDRQLKIPQDFSLVSITDIQLAQQMRPQLTTVAIHTEEIARLSVNLLLDLIANPTQQPAVVAAPEPTLIVRSSTCALA